MSKIRICDICGKQTEESGRYELIYKCIVRIKQEDICVDCLQKLKDEIKKTK